MLNTFPSVRKTLQRLLHVKVHETQVLLVSGLVVGVGAGLGAVVFRELISWFTYLFFDVLRPALSTLLGPAAIIFIPAIGGLIFGPLIYFFAREAKGHGVPEVMLAVAQKGGGFAPWWPVGQQGVLLLPSTPRLPGSSSRLRSFSASSRPVPSGLWSSRASRPR